MPAQAPTLAHPKNVPGDFYVAAECCRLCGIPRKMAPELFASDDQACWVSRQPATPSDYKKMLQVMESQEFFCVRYRGTDPTVRLVAPAEAVDPRDS
jgi:hypothetical protein